MTPNSTQLVTVGIAGFLGGYFLHQWLTSKKPSRRKRSPPTRSIRNCRARDLPASESSASSSRASTENSRETYTETSTDSVSESGSEVDLENDLEINSTPLNEIPGEVRMTLVVRLDLNMGKGKAAAQCSHATLALYKKMHEPLSQAYNPEMLRRWEYGNGQAKITLKVPNMEEMDVLFALAISLGVNAYIVHDAGRTQVAAGSATLLGLGPAPKSVLDQITSGLKLY